MNLAEVTLGLSLVLAGTYTGASATHSMIQGRLDVKQEARRAMEQTHGKRH